MMKTLAFGYEIEATECNWVSREIARVTMRKLGTGVTDYMTPDEAERFGQALIEAAAHARQKP